MQNFDFKSVIKNLNEKKPYDTVAIDFSEDPNKKDCRNVTVMRAPEGNFYVLDSNNQKEFIGQGGCGKVYKGYQIDPNTGKAWLKEDAPLFAIKMIDFWGQTDEKELIAKEVKNQQKLYPTTEQPLFATIDNKQYALIIMPYLPGHRLASFSEQNTKLQVTHQSVRELNSQQKLYSTAQLSLQLQQMHYQTIQRTLIKSRQVEINSKVENRKRFKIDYANPILNLDIKPENIHVKVKSSYSKVSMLSKKPKDESFEYDTILLYKDGNDLKAIFPSAKMHIEKSLPVSDFNNFLLPETGKGSFDVELIRQITAKYGRVEVVSSILDFGHSHELVKDKLQVTQQGGPLYRAPEILQLEQAGLKSPVYSFTSVAIRQLNGENPEELKNDREVNSLDKIAQTPFKLPEKNCIPKYPPYQVDKYAFTFLEYMQVIEHDQRADSDETARFFVTFNLFCLIYEELAQANKEHEALKIKEQTTETEQALILAEKNQLALMEQCDICAAKMALLAAGLWHSAIDTQAIYSISGNRLQPSIQDITFEHFDFASHPTIVKKILSTPVRKLKKDDSLISEITSAVRETKPNPLSKLNSTVYGDLKSYMSVKKALVLNGKGEEYAKTFWGHNNQVKYVASQYAYNLINQLKEDKPDLTPFINFITGKIPDVTVAVAVKKEDTEDNIVTDKTITIDSKTLKKALFGGDLYTKIIKQIVEILTPAVKEQQKGLVCM